MTETCKACSQPLVLELDPDDFDEATSSAVGGSPSVVPDDLELPCKCHWHWQCLLDESTTVAISLSCPSCHKNIVSTGSGSSAPNIIAGALQKPKILTQYTNEGGLQPALDILPLITEEAYLDANPAARPARAHLTMCAEGDVGGIIELLRNVVGDDDDMDEDDSMSPADLLRYQDPLDNMKSGLHLAVEKSQQEIVWMLLWLASNLPEGSFPGQAVGTARILGAGRSIAGHGEDIRSLKNEQGETVRTIAERMGGAMGELVRASIL